MLTFCWQFFYCVRNIAQFNSVVTYRRTAEQAEIKCINIQPGLKIKRKYFNPKFTRENECKNFWIVGCYWNLILVRNSLLWNQRLDVKVRQGTRILTKLKSSLRQNLISRLYLHLPSVVFAYDFRTKFYLKNLSSGI